MKLKHAASGNKSNMNLILDSEAAYLQGFKVKMTGVTFTTVVRVLLGFWLSLKVNIRCFFSPQKYIWERIFEKLYWAALMNGENF